MATTSKTHSHVYEAAEAPPVRKRLRSPAKYQPPLMPLIDVMFTLMLFFLVGTTMRQQEGIIPSSVPQVGGQVDVVSPLTVNIDIHLQPTLTGGVKYFVSNANVGFEQASLDANQAPQLLFNTLEQLRDARKLNPKETQVVLHPQGDVRWGYVAEAFNQAVRAKFEKIGFAPE